MEASASTKHLLHGYSDDDEKPPLQLLIHQKKGPAITRLLYLTVALLLASNTFLLVRYRRPSAKPPVVIERYPAGSKYAGLTYDTPVVYSNYTDYMSSDAEVADKLWASIDTSPMVVALRDDWATEHDIPISIFRFPWDQETKGLYYLKAYHGLHCLKIIHRAFADFSSGRTLPPSISGHVSHCLDALRQDMMCTADDTPMPMTDFPNHVGHGQIRQCRDFSALVDWSQAPERDACYRRWTDYEHVLPDRRIEMFAYCKEGSQYEGLMNAYFEKWGHKPAYGEGGMMMV